MQRQMKFVLINSAINLDRASPLHGDGTEYGQHVTTFQTKILGPLSHYSPDILYGKLSDQLQLVEHSDQLCTVPPLVPSQQLG